MGASIVGLGSVAAVTAVGGVAGAADPVAFAVIDCQLSGDQYMLGDGKADPADWTVEALDDAGAVVGNPIVAKSYEEREFFLYRTFTVPVGTEYKNVRFKSGTTEVLVDPVEEDCTGTPLKLTTGDPGTGLVSIPPQRLADTRRLAIPDGTEPAKKIEAGGTLEVKATDFAGVPADASAVLLNIAAVQPEGVGHLRAYPCGATLPKTSNVNYVAGEPRAASSLVKPGKDGKVCVYTSTKTHVLVDVQGYVAAKSSLTAIEPVRVADSRAGEPVDGPGLLPKEQVNGPVTLDMTKIAGSLGVPANAEGYVFNVTTANAAANGYVTVNRCLLTFRPETVSSAANFVAGRATANLAYGSYGDELCIYTSSPVDLMIDVVGYSTSPYGSPQLLDENLRLLETRPGNGENGTMDNKFNGIGRLKAGSETKIDVAGRKATWGAEVPTNISAALVNITAVSPSANGHVVAYECGKKPSTSNLNMQPGAATPNASLVPVGADGKICLFTSIDTDLIVDLTGFVSTAATPLSVAPVEITAEFPATQLEVLGGKAPYIVNANVPPAVKLAISDTGEISFTGDATTYVHYTGKLTVFDKNGLKAEVDIVIAWYPTDADVDSGKIV